jgi:hypothetical protein
MINAVHLLDHPAPGVYEDLLQDMFYVNEPIEAKDRDKQVKQPKPEVESRSHVFDVSKVDGGFRVSISKGQTSFPVNVAVTVAYDTRRGNPFARYSSLDFDLEDNSMQIDITKGKLLQRIRNKITARVEGADFVLSVTGFDQHRDIITDIREES